MLPDSIAVEDGRPLVWAVFVEGDFIPHSLKFSDGTVVRVRRACRIGPVEFLDGERRGRGGARSWFLLEGYPGPAALATPAGPHRVVVYAAHRAEPDALAGDEGEYKVRRVRLLPLDILRLYDEIEVGECGWAPEGW